MKNGGMNHFSILPDRILSRLIHLFLPRFSFFYLSSDSSAKQQHSLSLFFSLILSLSLFSQDLLPSQWPHLRGYWKFQQSTNLTKATVGNDLVLSGTHSIVEGPSATDSAVRISTGSNYYCTHNMIPNGGGSLVNRYTLMFDFKILSLKEWHTFFQTDTNNANDGECFIRPLSQSNPGRIGTATTGYTPDTVLPGRWYRLVISVNLGNYYRYYLNGKLILEGNMQSVDGRFALQKYFRLFADDNQEDDTIDIASVAIFDTCMSASEIASIGTIDPCVLHPLSIELGNDTSLCGSNALIKLYPKGYKYLWSGGDTSSGIILNLSKLGYGIHQVWVRKSNKYACVASDTLELGINPFPLLNLGPDVEVCKGQNIRLTGGPAGQNTYLWQFLPGAQVLSTLNFLNTDSSGIYTVRVETGAGCIRRDTVKITVHDNSTAPVLIPDKTTLCNGDTARISGPKGMMVYLWNTGDTASDIIRTNSSQLMLKTIDPWGCESPWSSVLVITFNPNASKPVIGFTNDTILCQGDSSVFYNNGNYFYYLWNDSVNTAFRTVKKSGVYSLKAAGLNGCFSVFSDTLTLKVNPRPVKPLIMVEPGYKTNLCPGDSTVIMCIDSSASYHWNSGQNSRYVVVSSSFGYSVIVENVFSCLSDPSDTLSVTLHPKPAKPTIVQKGTDSIMSDLPEKDYYWFPLGSTQFKGPRTIAGNHLSSYRLMTKNDFCFSDLSDSFIFVQSGIVSLSTENNLFVYPNPSAGNIFVKNPFASSGGMISIYNSTGQLICIMPYLITDLQAGLQLNHIFETGFYILEVSDETGKRRTCFVVQ